MKKIYYTTILFIATLLVITSCDDFLDRETYDSVNAGTFFQKESDLVLYANGFLQRMIPSANTIGYNTNDINADNVATQIPHDLLRPDGNVSPGNQGGWAESSWSNLRQINYFLDNMVGAKNNVSPEVYNHYEGVGRFWRAWFYYDKVQTFGAVPFYESVVQSSDQEQLYKARDSREFVMAKIMEDLAFAAENCLSSEKYMSRGTGISKWTVLAFMSRVALFEGTYRKYHALDPSTGNQWMDREASIREFLETAVSASEEIMNSGIYSLVDGDKQTAYRSLFVSPDLKENEVIWGRQFSADMSTYHNLSGYYYSVTYGNKTSLTKRFMNTYLMLDGTPFTKQPGYKTTEFKDEFDGRDYRMKQTVISPEYKMTINNVEQLYSPSWLNTRTGYQPIKFSIDNSNVLTSSTSWNSLPIFRYAEVLLNYAEAKAELGQMGTNEWNRSIALLRNRGGVTSIVPTTADPYMKEYFNNSIDDPWILEIRRERGIEMCLEMGLRWDDLMRWHMGELLNSAEKPWTGIYIPDRNGAYDFNGDGIIDFRIGSVETINSIPLSSTGSNQTFSLNADDNLVWNYNRTWSQYKYLRPVPTDAITRNPNLTQNYLWEGK